MTGFLDNVRLAGNVELDGRLRYEPEAVHLDDIRVTGHAIQLQGLGLSVNEPTLDFTTSGRLLVERMVLELGPTRLSCPTVTVQTPAISVSTDSAGAVQIAASATVQGDVARLRRCVLALPPNAPDALGGAFAGRIDLRPDDGRQAAQLELNVQNLIFGSPAAPAWREPRVPPRRTGDLRSAEGFVPDRPAPHG